MTCEAGGYLVVGGGLIGQASATMLAQRNPDVTVLTRVPPPQQLGPIDWRFGSMGDPELGTLLKGRRAVIYAAGSIFPATPVASLAQAVQDHVVPVVALAESAAAHGGQCFVFLSSGGTVYGDTNIIPTHEDVARHPINLYGTIKVVTEQALVEVSRRTGISVVSLRVSNPYGPGQQGSRRLGFVAAAVEAALSGAPVTIWGDGLNTRDFVHIQDVARAVGLAADFSGGAQMINIGSGQETSLVEVCRLVGQVSGSELEVRFEQARSIDVRRNALAIGRAAAVLGWAPEISLDAGIAGMFAKFNKVNS